MENSLDVSKKTGLLAWWNRTPLYLRIIGAMILGVVAGLLLGESAASLAIPSKLILRLLGALAPALILVAVIHALMTAQLEGGMATRLIRLLLLNTLVAIIIGLAVANVVQPGRFAKLSLPAQTGTTLQSKDALEGRIADFLSANNFKPAPEKPDFLTAFLENVPKSLLGPLGDDGKVIGIIFIAVAFGIALRSHRNTPIQTVESLIEVFLNTLVTILHWIIALVPFGVFGIVASIIGQHGFDPFKALGAFVGSVILALLLQTAYYLIRVRLCSWVNPRDLLVGTRDALVMAFSTASSTVTMPVTYSALKDRVGLRERSSSMGSLVGANFNNDGTALYEAMAALFIAQMLGQHLTLPQQLMVVLTSVVASVGAAGIPEAGLVTMTLVFHAVGLPPEYIAILLTVDWFLDRCRTTINVMGDMNISCLLDGKVRETSEEKAASAAALVRQEEVVLA
jgi:Na+/H+-dicarboxylate symporter